jgi:hypothetical protein
MSQVVLAHEYGLRELEFKIGIWHINEQEERELTHKFCTYIYGERNHIRIVM